MVDDWHRERSFHRLQTYIRDGEPKHIGYHYLITNGLAGKNEPHVLAEDGRIYIGRRENENGAHAFGLNGKSLGVCLIGSGQYTVNQLVTAHCLTLSLVIRYAIPTENVIGHFETPFERSQGLEAKTCPELDMQVFRATLDMLRGVR